MALRRNPGRAVGAVVGASRGVVRGVARGVVAGVWIDGAQGAVVGGRVVGGRRAVGGGMGSEMLSSFEGAGGESEESAAAAPGSWSFCTLATASTIAKSHQS